jgi:hypothetical protein
MMGLMQDVPSTVDRILDQPAGWHAAKATGSRNAIGHAGNIDKKTMSVMLKLYQLPVSTAE